MEMIIGRCDYAMRGADTGGHMAREQGRLRANHRDGVSWLNGRGVSLFHGRGGGGGPLRWGKAL